MKEDEFNTLLDQKWKNFCMFFPSINTPEGKNIFEQGMRAMAAHVSLPPIESEEEIHGLDPLNTPGRLYIPLPNGWEVQTQGEGSTYRLLDKKNGRRFPILVGESEWVQEHFTLMALQIHDMLKYPEPNRS